MVAARRPPRRWTLAVLLLAFVVLAAVGSLSSFYTDLLWFGEVDKTSVFWGQIRAKLTLGLLAGVGTGLIVGLNLWLVERLAPRYGLTVVGRPQIERAQQVLGPYLRPLRIGVSAFIGLVVGLQASGSWQSFLLWRNSVPFGSRDAQFNRDIGFYVFQLPFLQSLFGWLFTSLVLALVLAAAGHYLLGGIRPQAPSNRIAGPTQSHLTILLGLIVALKAWGYWLDKYKLVYSTRGAVTGATYTDVKAQLPALGVLFWVALICALLFFWGVRSRGIAVPLFSIVLLAGVSIIIGGVIPTVFQRFRVAPQELQRERPYIQRNIDASRKAFGLDGIKVRSFADKPTLTAAEVAANRATVDNIRLWDPEVLQPAIRNLQAIAQYYSFSDVDVDRYPVDDQLRQVMISVREVDPSLLPRAAQTWQNLHLAYTHGYGVVATQVNTAARQGQPDFIVSDFDQERAKIPVTQPRVYFGEPPEAGPEYVVVDTKQPEVDRPTPAGDTRTTSYEGDGGIELSSFGRRLAFALRFRDINLLISGNLTSQSRLLFNRDIRDRVEKVAPFLQWDGDPYAVVVNGHILFVRDGYTVSSYYPYVQRVNLGEAARRDGSTTQGVHGHGNYIRNSVKAVVDAYTGKVTLYAFDESDPVLRAWRKAFPDLFTPKSSIPTGLQEHLRYPEDLFAIQTDRYTLYHLTRADDVYSRKDLWALPEDRSGEIRSQQSQSAVAALAPPANPAKMRPYYLLTSLPGEEGSKFVLVMPFTPNNKQNLLGYLAASSNPDDYGDLTLVGLDPSRTIDGPTQVNARILANPRVASELSLLNQQGSQVILGNLLIVPVEDSLLYVQPIFVRSTTGSGAQGGPSANTIPLLEKVAVVLNTDVGYDTTLSDAIAEVVSGRAPQQPPQQQPPAQQPPAQQPSADVRQLLQQASREYDLANQALQKGDLAAYQQHVNAMAKLLEQALNAGQGKPPAAPAAAGGS
ncbi:MAG TPA: UPF0182 family protein [Actinomycetes bacterium]|nr:UPF0182 family protein [Actinomycetes bacterium]